MLFLSFEDLQGTLDAILFPEVYRQAKKLLSSDRALFTHRDYGDGYRTRRTVFEGGKSCLVRVNAKDDHCRK